MIDPEKPFDPAQVVEQINDLLARVRALEEGRKISEAREQFNRGSEGK